MRELHSAFSKGGDEQAMVDVTGDNILWARSVDSDDRVSPSES